MSKQYQCTIFVPYADIDAMGIVYYANYLVYFEVARAALLREVGLPYGEMEAAGVMLPVVESHCEYKKSAHYDDELVVYSTCLPFKGPRLRIEYEVRRGRDLIATGYTHHVCMSPDGKVLRPTPELVSLCQ
ncbi:MAG: acyl-CoA thioesterase [Verrucomicrobia bacterium]|jgi:acyl-CoA thioester hydrolase|nr:acyl-CoA thioesterase [Verrucomicrobiota bacterium]